MIKKIALILTIAASMAFMSCSEDKSSEPSVNDSQAFQNEMTGVGEDVMASKGVVAYSSNSQAMAYLPFSMPVKSISGAFGNITSAEGLSKAQFLKTIFPQTEATAKQVEHFVISEHYGSYTFNGYIYDEYNNIIDANWIIVEGGSIVAVIIPAAYTSDGKKFELILNDYNDEFIYWYDADQDYNSDYYPTLIDMEIIINSTEKVFDLEFTADWEYMAAMESVMPKLLDFMFDFTPYSLQITYSNTIANILNYTMVMKENLVTLMSIYAEITFVDDTLAEVSEIDFTYDFGNYSIACWSDVDGMEEIMDSDAYTNAQKIYFLNSGDYIWAKIYKNDSLLAQLKAREVWDEEEWNEATQSYGEYQIEAYFEFVDGSVMIVDMDDFEDLTGGF